MGKRHRRARRRVHLTTRYRVQASAEEAEGGRNRSDPASCSSCAWQAGKKLLADLLVLQKHRPGVLNPGADMRIYDNR